ncbi:MULTISPECIES: GPW/gp25 family protein [Avibacterium]|uniref:Phage baseplate-like protein n=1 Tax=Avibacterium paragallinarum TaxID=728 RepID=H6U8K8_AVIPA|nr:GPW/gp25 family protein [Avibacterium paragallinarum]AFA45193.1 protein 25-like lysozyme [Avibacterium paragallinarum]POY46212.1 phage baseplate protein [Avibacterium paragallinarum]RZN55088.1 phage baseplate protein [Avibacterium paragallinarum]RZN74016.1 phage baseplate protein [Avibacterium paragallinarum]STO71020.1 phage baseplate-like protein [Avibacterium paragallinarum]
MNTQLTTHWQLAPELDNNAPQQGLDDIHLCIANILNTIKGTDILRPQFGSDHFNYLDQPEDIAIPNIVREISHALSKWEPRIEVERIEITGTAPQFECLIYWHLKTAVYREIYQTVVKV